MTFKSYKLPASFLDILPAELRDIVYEYVVEDTEHVIIREGTIVSHPLSQVCRKLRAEFTSLIATVNPRIRKSFRPATTTLHVNNYDFEESVRTLHAYVDPSRTRFDVHVKVTKQLSRKDWAKMWPWIQYCDSLVTVEGNYDHWRIRSNYSVRMKMSSCDLYAACHALYVEVVPYLLKGASRGQTSAGYEQIEKMRSAFSNAVAVRRR